MKIPTPEDVRGLLQLVLLLVELVIELLKALNR